MGFDKDIKKDEIVQIEAQLLEQEHRPLTLIKNYFNRDKWNKNDPRRRAVKVAIFWRILFSPAVLATTGGLLAFLSLVVLTWQTFVLLDQNVLLTDQNKKINQQSYLIEAQRRSSLQFEISEILNRIDDELKRDNVGLRELSPELKSRIIAATVSMKPYRSYENDSLQSPYSYEKGQFFVALINSKIHEDDLNEIFDQGNFSNMILNNVVLGRYNDPLFITQLEIANSRFNDVEFRDFDIKKIDFVDCVFDGCRFFGKYSDLSFATSLLKNSSIAITENHDFGNGINFFNTEISGFVFTGDRQKLDNVPVSISGDRNYFKNIIIDGVLLKFDTPSEDLSVDIDGLILNNSFLLNLNMSKVEEHFQLSRLYVPKGTNVPEKFGLHKTRSIEGSDIFYENSLLPFNTFLIANREYSEFAKK
tara:strand:- start:371576 stop:372832 length:1257 start_codon:yes stop_codon:yes gene_type:complete